MLYQVVLLPFLLFCLRHCWCAALPQPLLLDANALGANTDWSNFQALPNLYGPRQCHPIPQDMKLCQSVGYNQMVLPNFLDHEDVKEAITQSNMWMTLAKTKCHADLNRFLCSLYAPVCLKGHQGEKIQPCYQLCEDVRQACKPRMNSFGYAWPPIVKCDQFPKQSNMCIPLTEKQSRSCAPCEQAITYESIVSSFCVADVVVKAKIKRTINRGSKIEMKMSKRVKYFKNDVKSDDATTFEMDCLSCSTLKQDGTGDKNQWLVMSRRLSPSQLDVMFVTKWDKNNADFMNAVRAMRKKEKLCQRFDLLTSNSAAETKATTPIITTPPKFFPLEPSHVGKIRPPRNQGQKRNRRRKNREGKKKNKKNRKNRNERNKDGKRRKNKKNRKNRKKRRKPKFKKGTPEYKEWKRKRRERRKRRRMNRMRSTMSPTIPLKSAVK